MTELYRRERCPNCSNGKVRVTIMTGTASGVFHEQPCTCQGGYLYVPACTGEHEPVMPVIWDGVEWDPVICRLCGKPVKGGV